MASKTIEARKLKGIEALKRKSNKEKEKLTRLLADQLKDDLNRLLTDGIEADLTFYLNKHSFKLHRCIIKSRDPTFYQALQTFVETEVKEVSRTVVDYLRTVVRYIYCEEDIKYVSHLVKELIFFFTTGKLHKDTDNFLSSNSSLPAQGQQLSDRNDAHENTPESVSVGVNGHCIERSREGDNIENARNEACDINGKSTAEFGKVKDFNQEPPTVPNKIVDQIVAQTNAIDNLQTEKGEILSSAEPDLPNKVVNVLAAVETDIPSEGISVFAPEDADVPNKGIDVLAATKLDIPNKGIDVLPAVESDIPNKETDVLAATVSTAPDTSNKDIDDLSAKEAELTEKQGEKDTKSSETTTSVTADKWTEGFTEAVSVLGSDLLYMYQEGVDVDVVLLAGQQRFYAHRCILCTRSEYFNAMLNGGWTESTTNEVIIQGLSSEVLEMVLLCIYGGLLENFDLALVAMGDMYNLSNLKMCMEYALLKHKCHFFHKPCTTCLTGVVEALAISSTYGLADLHNDLLNWSTKYYSRLWPTRPFAQLPEDILTQCEQALVQDLGLLNVISHALEIEKVTTALRNLKWGEPVSGMATRVMDNCLLYLGRHLKSYVLNRNPGLIDKEYRGMHACIIKELLVKATDFLRAEDAIKLFTILSEKCDQLKKVREARAATIELESYENFLSDVLELVEQYLVTNISQVISVIEWSELSTQQQEHLKAAAGYVFMGGDSLPKHKKPVLSNKQGLKFKPKKGKFELGKFGEPLSKSVDVIPKKKPDSYTGHQQVMKLGKTQSKGKPGKNPKTKVKPDEKMKVQSDCEKKAGQIPETGEVKCLSSQGMGDSDRSNNNTILVKSETKIQSSSVCSLSLLQNESETSNSKKDIALNHCVNDDMNNNLDENSRSVVMVGSVRQVSKGEGSSNSVAGLNQSVNGRSHLREVSEETLGPGDIPAVTFIDSYCTTLGVTFIKPE